LPELQLDALCDGTRADARRIQRLHQRKDLRIPENVVLFFQPPYAPEVNPCERVWQAFKTEIAWYCFADLEQLRQYLVAVLARYNEPMLHSLTSYPYLMDVINAVCLAKWY